MPSQLKRANKLGDMASVETQIRDLIIKVLAITPGRNENLLRAEVPEWDSLKHMELVFVLEDEFGVRFDEAEFAALVSPAAIAVSIARHLATRV